MELILHYHDYFFHTYCLIFISLVPISMDFPAYSRRLSIESSILFRASDNSKTGMGGLGNQSIALYGSFLNILIYSYNEYKGLPKHRQKRYTGKAKVVPKMSAWHV